MSLIHCAATGRCLCPSGLSAALQDELMQNTLALVLDTIISNPAWLLFTCKRLSPLLSVPPVK